MADTGAPCVLMCVNMAARYTTRLLPNALAPAFGCPPDQKYPRKEDGEPLSAHLSHMILDHLLAVISTGALPTFVCLPGDRATERPAPLSRFATTNEEWANLARIPRITGVAGSQEQEMRGAACSTRCRMRMATGGEQW